MVRKKRISRIYKFKKMRPYTYVKTKQGRYKKGLGNIAIVSFQGGNLKNEKFFKNMLKIVSLKNFYMTEKSVEALRVAVVRKMNKILNINSFCYKIKIYPHHILRYHRMASGAGADRISKGMRESFGVPLVRTSKVKINQTIIELFIDRKLEIVKKALKTCAKKICTITKIVTLKNEFRL